MFSLFAEGIAGRFVHVSPAEASESAGTRLTPATTNGAVTNDAPVVVVPAVIDDFADSGQNAGAYRVALLRQIEAFQSGMGTFDLDSAVLVSEIQEVAAVALKLPPPYKAVASSHLDRFFASAPFGELVGRLLPVLEDARIDVSVAYRYPGSRVDLERSRNHTLHTLNLAVVLDDDGSLSFLDPHDLVVHALKLFACGEPFTALTLTPDAPLSLMLDAARRLTRRNATIYDSAVAAVEIAALAGQFVEALRESFESTDRDHETEPADHSTETPPSVGGTQESRVDEIEFSDDDMTGTRADFDNDALDDATTGRGRGTSPESLEPSSPTVKEPEKERIATLEVIEVDAPGDPDPAPRIPARPTRPTNDQRTYFYHEWDYLNGTYLPSWCRLHERKLKGTNFGFIHDVRRQHATLAQQVRRRFSAIRPEAWHRVHRTPDGDEMSLDSLVEAVVDRRSGHATDEHLYIRRERAVRDVAAAFLLDMSRSTDSPVVDPHAVPAPPLPVDPEEQDPYLRGSYFDLDEFVLDLTPKRRVIDVAKEALALMCDALQTLGDSHAIYGFSGSGRHNVEFHVAKEFSEPTSSRTWAALGAIEPIRYTRMGPAIRHAAHKLAKQPERTKVLVVVTDGYPQDEGYGPDRNDRNYGIHDTAKALEEADAAGISTFCITIDPAGHDYLRRMCAEHRYLVIDDVHTLAEELEKVYRTLTGRGPAMVSVSGAPTP